MQYGVSATRKVLEYSINARTQCRNTVEMRTDESAEAR